MSERFAGRYLLLRPLGRGGMGEVFLARDLTDGAECALKRLTVAPGDLPPDALAREFEALTRVRHPEIVAVHELGWAPDGTPYITMEFVPGLPADRALARGDFAALIFVAARIAHGLEALHAAGVIHGDLKPSNVLVVPGGAAAALPASVRLLDFGLAALLGRDSGGHRGTPGYAAPEVVRGAAPSAASDLYALGATLFTLAAGRPAFEGEDVSAVLRRQQAGAPPAAALEEVGAPAGLITLLLSLLAPAPAERPREAREVRRALERLHPAARRPLAQRLEAVSLVGRERELARLAATTPESRLALVTGEAGAGKSALLDAVAARAALAGQWVTRLSCAGGEGGASTAAALLRRLAAGALADPEADEPADSPLRRALERPEALGERDLDAVAEHAAAWMRAIAERAGLAVVLLDDTERLEPAARALLRRLALHPGASAARWVWAGRPTGAEDERVLVEAGAAVALALGPLDRDGSARLAAARLGEPAPEALAGWLWARAGGHPGLTIELLRSAAAAGAIEELESGLAVDAAALERIEAPASFEASLLARIDALPAGPRAAAAALAMWARPVTAAALVALEPLADAAALEALTAAGVVARDERDHVRLSPPALGERILERLEPAAREALCRRLLDDPALAPAERFRALRSLGDIPAALDAAEAAAAIAPDARLAAEAASAAEGADPTRAAVWHERAAQAKAARGHFADAIPHLERSLALDPSSPARPARWELLARASVHGGRLQDAGRIVDQALAEPLPDEWRARLMAIKSAVMRSTSRLGEARELDQEAMRIAESTGSDATLADVLMNHSAILMTLNRSDEAEAAGALAEQLFRRRGDAAGAIRARIGRAHDLSLLQRYDEAERMYRDALEAARTAGVPVAVEDALAKIAGLAYQSGRWEEGRSLFEQAQRISLERGNPLMAAMSMISLTQADGLTGRPSAIRRGHAALRLARAFIPRYEAYALRSLAVAYRAGGRLPSARGAARRALALARRGGIPGDLEWSLIEHARLLAAAGRWPQVAALCDRALEERVGNGSFGYTVLEIFSARAALRSKGEATAARRLASVETWLEAHPAAQGTAFAEQLRAEMALAQRRIADGVEAARRALAQLAALPAPPDQAMAALDFARLALDGRGDSRAPVGEWLDLAAGLFERLGDHHHRERALALLVRWLRRGALLPTVTTPERNLIESVSRLLNSLPDLRELTRRAMAMAVEQLDAERGVLLLTDSAGLLNPIAEHGTIDATSRSDAVGYSRRVVGRVTEGGGALLIGDAPSDPRSLSESMVDMRLRSIVCVPMFLGGKVVGAVYLDDSRRAGVFSDADRGLLEGFAQLMAVAIENSRAQEEIQRANENLVGENLSLRQEIGARFQAHSIIGTSGVMQRIMAMAARAAMTNTTVLLTGENGTGKELLARVMHHSGKRRLAPFVAVNCGAIPETLLESELFGILPNVATGVRARDGRFVQANGGTLFLDEVGEMPLKQQVALLSAIANREITPVGGGRAIPVDVRLMAATNKDLVKAVGDGSFREDLYYRLNVIQIEVPPLRDRKADIPALAQHFVAHFAEQQERKVPQLSAEFLAALMQSDWPGNVRELQNYVERILAMSPGPVLYPDPLPHDLEGRGTMPRLGHGRKLSDVVSRLERKLVGEALERAHGNQSLAARELGMTEQSIRYKLRKYGLRDRESLRMRKNRR